MLHTWALHRLWSVQGCVGRVEEHQAVSGRCEEVAAPIANTQTFPTCVTQSEERVCPGICSRNHIIPAIASPCLCLASSSSGGMGRGWGWPNKYRVWEKCKMKYFGRKHCQNIKKIPLYESARGLARGACAPRDFGCDCDSGARRFPASHSSKGQRREAQPLGVPRSQNSALWRHDVPEALPPPQLVSSVEQGGSLFASDAIGRADGSDSAETVLDGLCEAAWAVGPRLAWSWAQGEEEAALGHMGQRSCSIR